MPKHTQLLFLLFTLLYAANATGNPGILVSVPFPLNVPALPLGLPLSIDNIVISNLELTNISVRELDYKWSFDVKKAEVSISFAQISFDWVFKKEKGTGLFRQDTLVLQPSYSFVASHSNHFQIEVTSTSIRPGHTHVSLGGGASQIAIVEVTNLVLNHASLLFRGFISKQITKTINDFGSIIGQDRKFYTDKQTDKEFYLNFSLVASPMITGQKLLVQVNGAPYIKGQSCGELNPEDILVKSNSTKIQVQIHKKIVSSFIALLLHSKGGEFSMTLHSLAISTTIDVNSLLLSPVFPKMGEFQDDRDVIFDIKAPEVAFSFNGQNLRFEIPVYSNVVTHNTVQKRDQLYIERMDGKMVLELEPIFGSKRCSIRIAKTQVLQFTPKQGDIDAGRIRPEALTKYFDFLTEFLGGDVVNFELNRKVVTVSYGNILAVLKGSVLKEVVYHLQIDLLQF